MSKVIRDKETGQYLLRGKWFRRQMYCYSTGRSAARALRRYRDKYPDEFTNAEVVSEPDGFTGHPGRLNTE